MCVCMRVTSAHVDPDLRDWDWRSDGAWPLARGLAFQPCAPSPITRTHHSNQFSGWKPLITCTAGLNSFAQMQTPERYRNPALDSLDTVRSKRNNSKVPKPPKMKSEPGTKKPKHLKPRGLTTLSQALLPHAKARFLSG